MPLGVQVTGRFSGVTPGQVPETPPPWVYVLVRPVPGDPEQSWWVQPYPLLKADGTWEGYAWVGVNPDPAGTPFRICAIISYERLSTGRYGKEPPPSIASQCLSVTRQ